MATQKMNPEKVYDVCLKVYSKLNDIDSKNQALFKNIKTLATGNKGKSYWNGERAFSWYCSAIRNSCNSFYRVSKMAEFYASLCKSAYELYEKDGGKGDTAFKLGGLYTNFNTLKSNAESHYNTVKTFGLS